MRFALVLPLAGLAAAFPSMKGMAGGIDLDLHKRQQPAGDIPGGAATCPFNPNHKPAAPWNIKFPYNWANLGLPGRGKGGYQVPAPGDDAHKFVPPTDKDIRGPCPALNALANHNFIAHDGITNYNELLDALQNVFNVGYDLANFLAAFAIYVADGDPVTRKLSIGCDATTRTSWNPAVTGSEPGLDGHNKMEMDVSMTRNDYFTGGGDNFSFNTTLWKGFVDTVQAETGVFDVVSVSKWRYLRYNQCRVENPNLYFGPLFFFQYGAASFLYELWPNGNEGYVPTLQNTATFFGAKWDSSEHKWKSVPERIPDNWVNRKTPYTLLGIAAEIIKMYGLHPVGIGGSVDGHWVGIDFPPYIVGGESQANTAADITCLAYQLISMPFPSSLNGIITPTVGALSLIAAALGIDNPQNLGCPLPLT